MRCPFNPLRLLASLGLALLLGSAAAPGVESGDPATEPAVLAVSRALPAVVNINTERVVRRAVRDPFDEFANQFFGSGQSRPLTVRQKVQSLGSGFIVDPAGYIVTNEHVVARAADLKIFVTTQNGQTYTARYVTGSTESDLAFLKIESKEPLPFIGLRDLSPNLLGETVLVLGNPLGYGSSVARGILSAKGRTITVDNAEYKNLIQTDAAINPGNSGGPLIDLSGRLIGVASVKMAFTPQGVPTQGLGFAISGEAARAKVEQFKQIALNQPAKGAPKHVESESLARRYFGLHLQDLTPELKESFNVNGPSGVLVADVDPDSPAEQSGVTRGIVIYQAGRFEVSSVKQVEGLLEPIASGSVVDFTVGVVRKVRNQMQRQLQPLTLVAR